jgi:hypothetical protein
MDEYEKLLSLINSRLPVLVQMIVYQSLAIDEETIVEPEEDIQPGDNVIGPISKRCRYLYAFEKKISDMVTYSITTGLKKLLDDVLEETKGDEAGKLLGRGFHPQNIILSRVAYDLLKASILFDKVNKELFDKEVLIRKGFVAVWREPETKPENE